MSHELWLRQAYEALVARGDHTLANTCSQASVAYAALEAEVERLNKSLDVAGACATDKNRQFAEMKQRIDHLESCEVDAKRYRWIRDSRHIDVLIDDENEDGPNDVSYEFSGSALDEKIDADIAQSQPQPLPEKQLEPCPVCLKLMEVTPARPVGWVKTKDHVCGSITFNPQKLEGSDTRTALDDSDDQDLEAYLSDR